MNECKSKSDAAKCAASGFIYTKERLKDTLPKFLRDSVPRIGYRQANLGDSVTILAESVEWPDEIDIHRAEEAKIRAERRIHDNSQDIDRAELALKRAMLRLEMTKKV